jgi:hypothetical protein
MPSIELDSATFYRIRLLAHAWGVHEGRAVQRLVDDLIDPVGREAGPDAGGNGEGAIEVYAVYEGVRTNALFTPTTERVDIVDGSLAGQSFKRPSGAAVAVVRARNPAVNPNRNGWSFWTVASTGLKLQSVRR